jgi:hypothetical protein
MFFQDVPRPLPIIPKVQALVNKDHPSATHSTIHKGLCGQRTLFTYVEILATIPHESEPHSITESKARSSINVIEKTSESSEKPIIQYQIPETRGVQENNVITTNNTEHTIKGNVKNRMSILPDSPSCPSEFCWEGAI